jgi:hypothetical protein
VLYVVKSSVKGVYLLKHFIKEGDMIGHDDLDRILQQDNSGWSQPPIFIKTTDSNYQKIRQKSKSISDFSVHPSIDHNQQGLTLPFVKALSGRGQDGLAGFFGNPNDQRQQFLIKVDDPATCVLEATARFAKDLMLPTNQNAVNFATAGVLKIDQDSSVISIQPRVKAQPWDVLVYGSKRNPKTPISKEAMNKKTIVENINQLSDKAQWDLANALFVSTVIGDESLHIGQFMANVNQKGEVEGITRIDFGARERFSAARYYNNDFGHKTSNFYASSGQKGKDYISYILKQPDVRRNYLSLWARQMDIQASAQKHSDIFLEEVNKLPTPLQQKALDDILKTMFKKSTETSGRKYKQVMALPLEQKKAKVANLLKKVTNKRMTMMQQKARNELFNDIINQYDQMNKTLSSTSQQRIKNIMEKSDETTAADLDIINNYLNKKLTQGDPQQAIYYQAIAQTIISRQKLAQHENLDPQVKSNINDEVKKMEKINVRLKVMSELSQYKSYLENKGSTAEAKKEMIDKAIRQLQRGKDPSKIIDETFKSTISKRRILTSSASKSNGAKLLDRLEAIVEESKSLDGVKNSQHMKSSLKELINRDKTALLSARDKRRYTL